MPPVWSFWLLVENYLVEELYVVSEAWWIRLLCTVIRRVYGQWSWVDNQAQEACQAQQLETEWQLLTSDFSERVNTRLMLFNIFINAFNGGTECDLKHDDTQLGGANDILEDRATVQRDLERKATGLAESSAMANAMCCSWNPTTLEAGQMDLTD